LTAQEGAAKHMKKASRFFLTAAILAALHIPLIPRAQASAEATEQTGPAPSIVEEIYIPLEDDFMDSLGWVTLQASPPPGFEGSICVELRNKRTGASETLTLDAMTGYYGGGWVPSGTYKVSRAYVPDSDYFSVSWDEEEISVTDLEDACLTLTVISNGTLEKELEQIASTFVPNIPPEPTVPETTVSTSPAPVTEASAESEQNVTEAAVPTTAALNPEHSANSSQLYLNLLIAAIFIGIIFLIVDLVKKYHGK